MQQMARNLSLPRAGKPGMVYFEHRARVEVELRFARTERRLLTMYAFPLAVLAEVPHRELSFRLNSMGGIETLDSRRWLKNRYHILDFGTHDRHQAERPVMSIILAHAAPPNAANVRRAHLLADATALSTKVDH